MLTLAIPLILLFLPFGPSAQTADSVRATHGGPAEFMNSVEAYIEIHRLAAAALGPEVMCSDPEELFRQEWAFAAAILEARPSAREGEIFTAAASGYFRRLIAVVARDSRFDLLAALEEDDDESGGDAHIEVNRRFPWSVGNVMWPTVLQELPLLPEELEYRFVKRDLVLIDIRANLVVDVLRDALPGV